MGKIAIENAGGSKSNRYLPVQSQHQKYPKKTQNTPKEYTQNNIIDIGHH